jgi:hypothetical protein
VDTGTADPRLARALTSYDGSPAAHAEVHAALVDARVFAPVTATATAEHVEERTGLRAESTAELAVLLLATEAGDRALPVFTSTDALRRWRLDVRPVALTGPEAAQAAVEQGATALLVDGSVSVHALAELAAGWVPVAGTGLTARTGHTSLTEPAEVPPGLVSALREGLAPERLRSARLLQGPDGLVLGVAARPVPSPAELAALGHRLLGRLGDALPPAGLDLTVVPARGPGTEVLARSRWRR